MQGWLRPKFDVRLNSSYFFWQILKKLGYLYRWSHFQITCMNVVFVWYCAGKHLCHSLFLIKSEVVGFIKKEIPSQMFSCEFCNIFKNSFSKEHLWVSGSINSATKFMLSVKRLYNPLISWQVHTFFHNLQMLIFIFTSDLRNKPVVGVQQKSVLGG